MERNLTDFLGFWQISREIAQADGTRALFTGHGTWTQRPDGGADYAETGQLEMGGGRFTAERRYHWTPGLDVYFDDGRFFHRVPAGGGATGHWCDPDQYDVRYDFADWPAWTVVWQVHGPRKDYTMTSRYTR
ncbi:DUF6314 family protein [Sagittula sp. SSi028]|uniref:DUF6314 family protein n=1 Tax=Sagittula sp. SSi028 TaxID=3400636 RepID=UPI003AF929D2